MPFKPPVELSRPTILNIIAIVCYCLAILFHLIAFATDNWSSLMLSGVRYKVGLWQGCRHNETTDEWMCSSEVFEDEAFKSGKSSDWHIGTRIMMIFALILLFVLQFFIIAYACIRRLERYKSKLVGIILGLSATSGTRSHAKIGAIGLAYAALQLHYADVNLMLTLQEIRVVSYARYHLKRPMLGMATLASLIIFGAGGPKGRLEWAYGVALLSLVFQLICLTIVLFDRYRTNLAGKSMRKSRECGFQVTSLILSGLEIEATPEARISWSFGLVIISVVFIFLFIPAVFCDSYRLSSNAFCHFLVLIMYGSEVGKIPDSSVEASFGIIVIAFLLELAIIVLTQIDKRRRFPSENVFIETGVKDKHGDRIDSKSENNRAFTIEDHTIRSSDRKGSTRTSVSSLSETETFRKFASLDPAAGYDGKKLDQKSPTRTSVSSLTEAETYRKFGYREEPASSTGSSRSVHTQGTVFTNLSSSMEFRV